MKTLSDNMTNVEQETYDNIYDLLQGNKKIVAFVGSSKSGTSFLLNTTAKLLSSKGINVAILDATKNKSSYYIYTKSQDGLRKIAWKSIEKLSQGIANGIKADENLTVYTGLPNEKEFLEKVESVLRTLIKNHTVILIDCDYDTPIDYFKYAQEIYLVQSMDILAIQPFTEALSKIEEKGLIEERKFRIIINKFLKIDGVSEKEIIGGMAFYNEPAMSYMKQLFNKNTIRYMVIPFDEDICTRYIKGVSQCEISLNGYSNEFLQILGVLADNIYLK